MSTDDLAKRLRRDATAAKWTTEPPESAPQVDPEDALAAADRIEALERLLAPELPVTEDEHITRLQEWEGRIRREALEEAARCIEPKNPREDWTEYAHTCAENAAAIRALKGEQ